MKGSDVNRLMDLRRLFDRVVDTVSDISDPKNRQKQAARLMDNLIGAEWRSEVKKYPGVTVFELDIVKSGPKVKDPEKFYQRVERALRKYGLDASLTSDLPHLPKKPIQPQQEEESEKQHQGPVVIPVHIESAPCPCLMCRLERIERAISHC